MRVCGARARDALAAPSSFAQLLNELFFKGKRLSALSLCPVRVGDQPFVDAKYSTALSRPGQHLFFGRQHHARPDERRRRVVTADRDERAPPVEQRDVRAVLPPLRRGGAHRHAVADEARLLGR